MQALKQQISHRRLTGTARCETHVPVSPDIAARVSKRSRWVYPISTNGAPRAPVSQGERVREMVALDTMKVRSADLVKFPK